MIKSPAESLNLTLIRSVVAAEGAHVVSICIQYVQFPWEAWPAWFVGWFASAWGEMMLTNNMKFIRI